MEEDDQPLVLKSNGESMISVTLGRVMSTLLSARPKKLQDVISRFSETTNSPSLGSMEESLWLLYQYVRDAVEREEQLDQIIIPMIEHSLQSKGSRRDDQVLRLLNWLFQDESVSRSLTQNLISIISRKEDHYIAYGWCNLVRDLLDSETLTKQYLMNGLGNNYGPLLKALCTCIPHLSSIICKGSCTSQDGHELPSRLAAAAADCLLAITEALTRKEEIATNQKKSFKLNASRESSSLLLDVSDDKKVKDFLKFTNMEREKLLLNHIQELVNLVQRLLAWSRKSRPLHSKGLEGVLKWLLFIKGNYGQLQDEADVNIMRTGELLLSSCWKHYSMLLHIEDYKFSQQYREWFEQFLSGIKLCAERCSFQQNENNDGTAETQRFFLNCLCLVLGRLSGKRFQAIVAEHGLRISEILLSQLKCGDEDDDVIDEVVCIFKETVFKLICSSEGRDTDTRVDAVVALLLQLLDETDGTARAVAMLIGEYCAMDKDNRCLSEVLDILAHGNDVQQRNTIGVVSHLIHMSSKSANGLPHLAWTDIASHLLGCLGSVETAIIKVASDLLPMIDPSLVLPALVRLFYSADQRIHSYVRDALIGVLKYHSQNPGVIPMLLDCLSDLNNNLDLNLTKTTGGVVDSALTKFDYDKVLQLTPEWIGTVEDWKVLVGPLIDKLYADPSNAIIVRLLSQISEHLADAADIVLQRVLLRMQGQEELDESGMSSADSLFERLCPLLILRLLPLKVFTSCSSSIMYGQHPNQGNLCVDIEDDACVAAFLLKRAFSKYEYQDVRKLAAELCGRLDPLGVLCALSRYAGLNCVENCTTMVLFPIVRYHLEKAISHQDVLKIKTCLFSVCTSLVVRGKDIIFHPVTFSITKLLETILMWPSTDEVEVSKAQHGCIDCMALMICAELESLTSFKESSSKARSKGTSNSLLTLNRVIQKLMHCNATTSTSELSTDNYTVEGKTHLPFRLCMANVLISACQKIGESGRERFARKTIPAVINSIKAIANQEIKSACIQVLFSAVYHLKSVVLPYSSKLIKLCLKFLKDGSEKERMACTKLLASLMASEDAILTSISGELLEARSLLSTLSRADPSPEVRKSCQHLLLCLTTPS